MRVDPFFKAINEEQYGLKVRICTVTFDLQSLAGTQMGHVKQKRTFEHAQNVQIQITLCMAQSIWAYVLHSYIL